MNFFQKFPLLIPSLLNLLSCYQVEGGNEFVEPDPYLPGRGDSSFEVDKLLSFPHTAVNESIRCGEIFGWRSGGIFYKPFQSVLPNERCIWMITVSSANGYEVTVQYFGYEPDESNKTEHGLIISDFRKGRKPNHFIPTNTSTMTLSNTGILMVTFFSGVNTIGKSGFILQFKAITTGNSKGLEWTDSMIMGPEQYFKVKNIRFLKSLNIDLICPFVLLPKNNIYRDGKEGILIYRMDGSSSHSDSDDWDEICQKGYFLIYFFNATGIGKDKWEFQGRTCESLEMIRSADVMLLIFQSDRLEQNEIQLTYVHAT